MSIWKDLLLQNVKGYKLKNAKTILEADRNKNFQVFEVLVTETLAIVDPSTQWNSLPVQGDGGVDFIGKVLPVNVPYLISKPTEIVLGQIKRRSGAYTKDDFHYDIIKIIEHYNKNYSQKAALFQIIHVLSTDKKVNPTKWLENITYPYASYNVLPVNAIDFLKFWKINKNFLKLQLEDIYSIEHLQLLFDYIDKLEEDWNNLVHIEISVDDFICVDEEINIKVCFTSSVDLSLVLYLEWIPSSTNSDIVVIYPSNIIKNNISNYFVSVYRNLNITIKLKAICIGMKDLGSINVYSSSGELIYTYALGELKVDPGLTNKFYSLPCKTEMLIIKEDIKNKKDVIYKAYTLIGQGGIGKTRLVQEILLFAQNNNFYTVAVQNANDLSNMRSVIFDLLMKILNNRGPLNTYAGIYQALRDKLGANFNSDWHNAVLNYLIGGELYDCDLEQVAQCILTLLIVQLHNQPVFIWMCDMHWASKETLVLIEKVLNLLKLNKAYLKNSLIILLEGRDSDALELEDKILFPYKWLDFSIKDSIKTLTLPVWKSEYIHDYIEMLIDPMKKCDNIDKHYLIEYIKQHTTGNPMHIKELIYYLIETENVFIHEDGSLKLIGRNINLDLETLEINEIVSKRLLFYRKNYSAILDCYIILASLCENLATIYNYIKQILSKIYLNYPMLEKKIGIVSDTKAEKIFLHEYYKEILKSQQIQDEKYLESIYQHYYKICDDSVNERLDLIYLKMMYQDVDYNGIANELLTLLQENVTDSQALNCYQILEHIPAKFRKNKTLAEIYFTMSDIAIRIGSWKDSQKYLEKILNLKCKNEIEELYYILACKNLGNMYGVGLELKKSIEICQVGLNTVENKLKSVCFTDNQLEKEFQRQYEMLLNRIAVTYWFSGQDYLAVPYQEKALSLAENRNDIYSMAHTLYETGMRQLHNDIYIGHENIEKALNLLPPKGKYTENQERYLVRIELLISQILIYSKEQKNTDLLERIIEDSKKICEELTVGNVNYESSLCHIVNAIAHIFKEEYEKALSYFETALECANLGEFNTLRWKLYLNIAETLMLLYEQDKNIRYFQQALKYARYGKKILDDAIEINKELSSYCYLVEKPSYYFQKILGEKEEFPQDRGSQEPISIPYKDFEFYIMD